MNINGYDVVYDGQVYHVVDLTCSVYHDRVHADDSRDFEFLCDNLEEGIHRPEYLFVYCFDSDGGVRGLYDEAQRFRFVRRTNHE